MHQRITHLCASANFKRSFSYFNCCSLCGPDSVDVFSDDDACFIISMFAAFELIFVCIGLSGLVFWSIGGNELTANR